MLHATVLYGHKVVLKIASAFFLTPSPLRGFSRQFFALNRLGFFPQALIKPGHLRTSGGQFNTAAVA